MEQKALNASIKPLSSYLAPLSPQLPPSHTPQPRPLLASASEWFGIFQSHYLVAKKGLEFLIFRPPVPVLGLQRVAAMSGFGGEPALPLPCSAQMIARHREHCLQAL